jgi:heterodisulfide reductase subunit C
VIQALRTLSQRLGLFVESEKGRQQLAIKRTIGQHILDKGYCISPKLVNPSLHPEQGPVWEWVYNHDADVFGRFTPNYSAAGVGPVREIDSETLGEILRIFEVTGGLDMYDTIEEHSRRKAREMGFADADKEYFMEVFRYNSNNH